MVFGLKSKSCRTISEPIDPVPPVTKIVFPLNSFSMFFYDFNNFLGDSFNVLLFKAYIKRESQYTITNRFRHREIAFFKAEFFFVKTQEMDGRQVRFRRHAFFS